MTNASVRNTGIGAMELWVGKHDKFSEPGYSEPVDEETIISEGDIIIYRQKHNSVLQKVYCRVTRINPSHKSFTIQDGILDIAGNFVSNNKFNTVNKNVLNKKRTLWKYDNTRPITALPGPIVVEKPKATRNRDSKVSDPSWIVKDEDMLKYERMAKNQPDKDCHGSRATYFLKLLYKDSNYIREFQKPSQKLIKRGANAKNWRDINRVFKCSSLHKADNIYQSLGKSLWSKKHKKSPANTWPTITGKSKIPPFQCRYHTKFSNAQCKRSSHKSPSCMCTQHQFIVCV
uniref:Uncharacterized protein n=1 Tax=viral metagenome TaxID=1070528 RepID=A0A6C0C8G0_9ZZZZ